MRQKNSAWCFYVGQFAQFTLRAYWLVLYIPRSDDAPACQVALPNARGACLLPATNRNADSIASSALTKFVSGKAKSHPGTTHPRESERPCRHSVTPFPNVRYRMVSTSICLPSTDTGIGNPIIGSVCNDVESQTSTNLLPNIDLAWFRCFTRCNRLGRAQVARHN